MVDAGDDLIVIPPRPSALQKLLRMLALLAGIVWALPLTLVGLLLALPVVACRGEVRLVRSGRVPALLFSGRAADYMLERHPFGAMCAMAIGHVVIAERSSLTRRILTHELAHVRQAACWGILFPSFIWEPAPGQCCAARMPTGIMCLRSPPARPSGMPEAVGSDGPAGVGRHTPQGHCAAVNHLYRQSKPCRPATTVPFGYGTLRSLRWRERSEISRPAVRHAPAGRGATGRAPGR